MEDSLASIHEEIIASFKEEKTYEEKLEFEGQMLAFAFLSEIEREMEAKGMKRKDLANAVGKSPGYITQLFRGNKLPNLNILAAMGIAVSKLFDVKAVDSLEVPPMKATLNGSETKLNTNKRINANQTLKHSKKKNDKAKVS